MLIWNNMKVVIMWSWMVIPDDSFWMIHFYPRVVDLLYIWTYSVTVDCQVPESRKPHHKNSCALYSKPSEPFDSFVWDKLL